MRKLTKILILLGLVINLHGCAIVQSLLPSDFTISEFFADSRDYTETQHLITKAQTFQDIRDLQTRAVHYENLLDARHFEDGYFTVHLILSSNIDPHGFSDAYVRRNVSDSASYGSKILTFRALQYAVGEGYDPIRYKEAFNFVRTLCKISGVQGHVVRGIVPDSLDFPKDPEDKWFPGIKTFDGWSFRSDPSPGQIVAVAQSLYTAFHFGPEEYKDESASLLREIAIRLIENDFQIIDIDGESTQISHFDPRHPIIGFGLPDRGTVALYINDFLHPDFVGTNRGRRNLELLTILFAAMSTSKDQLIASTYYKLVETGYSERASNAPFNFLGITEAGNELSDFDNYFVLLNPLTIDLQPKEATSHYRHALDKSWSWFKDFKHPSGIPIYVHVTPGYQLGPGTDSRVLAESSMDMLYTSAIPNRRRNIVLSNHPNMLFAFWPSIGLDTLSATSTIPELWQRRASSYFLSRDPRRLDSEANTKEYAYVDWLYAFWLMRFVDSEKIKATQQPTLNDRILQIRPGLQLRSRM